MPLYIRYRRCVICGIRSGRLNQEKRKFMARLPLDPDHCRKWVKVIGNEDLVYIPIEKLHQLKYVCGDHFQTKDFNKKKSRLKKWAVPSVKIQAQSLSDDLLVEFPYHISKSEIRTGCNTIVPSTTGATLSASNAYSMPSADYVVDYSHHVAASVEIEAIQEETHDIHVPSSSGVTASIISSTHLPPEHVSLDHDCYIGHASEKAHPNIISMNRPKSVPSSSGVVGILTTNVHTPPGFDHDYNIRPTSEVELKKITQNHSKDIEWTPRKKKLLMKLEKNKITLRTLQKKVQVLDSIESPALKTLVMSTVKNQKRKHQARRWSNLDKGLALSIYKKSPKVYRFLRHLLPMPSVRTLQTVLQRMILEPGVNNVLMNHLKNATQSLREEDKICVILFDEMALKKRLILNTTSDKIDGYQDLADEGGRSENVADHALVVMLQGVTKKFKQPLAHYFVKGTISSEKLTVIIKKIIRRVSEQGYSPISTVCDQGPTNVGALNLLKKFSGISQEENYFVVDDKKIFILYDVPHLFKSIRNNFLQAGEVLWANKKGKWKHLIALEEINKKTLHFTKITKLAVQPRYKSKMKVKLAAQILSNTVAAVLKLQAESAGDVSEKKELLETAQVIEDLDQLFDCTNGPASYKDRKKYIRENVYQNSFHHEKWNGYIEKLKTARFLKTGSNICLKNVKCVNGYVISLKSLQDIWSFLESKGIKYMNLRQLNQDALENLFGLIRQHSPTNRNPTCHHFTSALKSSILTRLSTPTLRGANCEQDGNRIIFDFHDIVFRSKEVGKALEDAEEQQPCQPTTTGDDLPVLHIPDDSDDDEENLMNFDNQPAVYVSGFVAKKLLYNIICNKCRSVLEADENIKKEDMYKYIYLREWDKDTVRLTYPSKALCMQIISMTKVFEEKVKGGIYNNGIIEYCRTMMLANIDLSWLCPEHYSECAEKLALTLTLLLLRNECRRQNDTFSISEESSADLLKKAEQSGTAK